MMDSALALLENPPVEGDMNYDPELLSVLDDKTREAVGKIIATLDGSTREAILESVQLLDESDADVPTLVSLLKGKADPALLPGEHCQALRGLYNVARQHRPW